MARGAEKALFSSDICGSLARIPATGRDPEQQRTPSCVLSGKPIKGHRPALGGSSSPTSALEKGLCTTEVAPQTTTQSSAGEKQRVERAVGVEKLPY